MDEIMGEADYMAKDLTTSQLDRQNVLNNDIALPEIQKAVNVKCIVWNMYYILLKIWLLRFLALMFVP